MCLRECVLRDILGILTMAQHRIGNAEGQSRTFDEPCVKLPLELWLRGHDVPGQTACPLMHRSSRW